MLFVLECSRDRWQTGDILYEILDFFFFPFWFLHLHKNNFFFHFYCLVFHHQQMRKGKKGSIDPSGDEDLASPLVLAVASSPRVSRKRLGSNSIVLSNNNNNNDVNNANDPGKLNILRHCCIPFFQRLFLTQALFIFLFFLIIYL